MADIRINALATTAASTASDDFVAVDGSANGTRKLNAFSPTFGGNLTVSGTGTSSFSGRVRTTSNDGFDAIVSSGNTGLGLGSGSQQYSLYLNAADNSLRIYSSPGGDRLAVSSGGNFLLGTTTDSSNGKVQLATHTTSAGGIGFGTDVSLYRSGNNRLFSNAALTVNSNNSGSAINGTFQLNGGGTSGGNNILDDILWGAQGLSWLRIYGIRDAAGGYGGTMYFQTMNGSGTLTTALTLDSSQRAIFSPARAASNLAVKIISSGAATNADRNFLLFGHNTAANAAVISQIDNTTTGAMSLILASGTDSTGAAAALTLDSSQNATFAGNVTISKAGAATNGLNVTNTNASGYASVQMSNDGGAGNYLLTAVGGSTAALTNARNYGFAYTPAALSGFRIFTSGALTATFDNSNNTILEGSIKTSAPTGGAGAWELGVYTATAPTATGYVTIEIGGTQYKLLAATA